MPPEVIAALLRGQKIEAIKHLRMTRGFGLQEAKEAVENYVATDPVLRARLGAAQEQSRRGCLTYVGVIFALAVAVYMFLRSRG
jgi:hypothetical protein